MIGFSKSRFERLQHVIPASDTTNKYQLVADAAHTAIALPDGATTLVVHGNDSFEIKFGASDMDLVSPAATTDGLGSEPVPGGSKFALGVLVGATHFRLISPSATLVTVSFYSD